jgi:hypothetical protein
MPSLRDRRTNAGPRGLVAVALALIAVLAISSSAMAGQDQLKGGSVVFQLQGSRGLKLKPASLNLAITGGAFDPVDGSGTVQVSGGFRAKRGKHKAKVKFTALTFGANGGPGSIDAKIGKRKVNGFGRLAGGTVSREGWGARLQNVSATIASKGARALTRAFSPRKHKGAKKSARGRVKAGQRLGTIVSMTTDPLSVEVVPGTGTMILRTDAMGSFVSKLPSHCVDPLPTGSPPGVAPIAPATAGGLLGTDYSFPVTGGAVAPDFSAGELVTGGGQTITKNHSISPLSPGACDTAEPPVGTQLPSVNPGVAFGQNFLMSTATLPTGTSLRAALGTIDFSTGSRSIDPSTKTLTVTGATVTLADLASFTLNTVFPTESGSASDDFVAGDLIGKIDITGAKLR